MPNSLNSLLNLVVDWCTWHLIRALSHKPTWWIVATITPNLQKPKSCLLLFSRICSYQKQWNSFESFLKYSWIKTCYGDLISLAIYIKKEKPAPQDWRMFLKQWKSLTWHASWNVHSCIHLVKNLERGFGKGSQNLGGDWINRLSITLKQTNWISCLLVKLYHYSSCFLLVSHTSQPHRWLPLFNWTLAIVGSEKERHSPPRKAALCFSLNKMPSSSDKTAATAR